MTQKCFLAARNDGLGERLRAMVNALALTEHFGNDFRFHWRMNPSLRQRFHCIRSPDDTFSADFVAAHHLAAFDPADYPEAEPVRAPPDAIRDRLGESGGGLRVNHQWLPYICDLGVKNYAPIYRKAFDRIAFAPHAAAQMERARTIDLPANATAVHLRAGDVVYGYFRFTGTVHRKVLSYPVAKAVVARLVAAGRYPLIFGEDAVTCRLLADGFGVRLATDWLPPSGDALADALGEIVLMSRCGAIQAGTSGFAMMAAMISGGQLTVSPERVGDKDLFALIAAEPDMHDPATALPGLQRSFAYASAAHFGLGRVPTRQVIKALRGALVHDPANIYYSLFKAKLEDEIGNRAALEATLEAALGWHLRHDPQGMRMRIAVERAYAFRDGERVDLRAFLSALGERPKSRPHSAKLAKRIAELGLVAKVT